MNSEYVINSIYNPKKKGRESFVFPKIAKGESTPDSKVFARAGTRKYNQQNIFKLDDDKKKIKLRIEDERFKDVKSREVEELEAKMADLTRRHQEEMRDFDEVLLEARQAEKRVLAELENEKKERYQVKLGIWEMKNQIMELNSICQEEEGEYQRLSNILGYHQEYEEEEAEGEGELQAEGEAEMEAQEEYQQGEGQQKAMSVKQAMGEVLREQQNRHECQSML